MNAFFPQSSPTVYTSKSAHPNFSSNISLPRHRWYRFKEGFSANLVQAFTTEHFHSDKESYLLDPFLGSGTTVLEGAKLGYNVHGLETNPFMAFLSKVKTRDYTKVRNIERVAVTCLKGRRRDPKLALPNDTTLVERRGLTKWLFNYSVAKRFEQIWTAILDVSHPRLRELLLLALMASAEDVANARKDGKCWRYKANWSKLNFCGKSLEEAFAAHILRFVEDISVFPRLDGTVSIVRGDARRDISKVGGGKKFYDGILTSPPYLNSFDYTDIYRPELLLMKAVRSSSELRELRFRTMRSHVQVAWQPSPSLKIPLLQKIVHSIGQVGSWDSRIPDMINAYFVDLDRVVKQCIRRLKDRAIVSFVVADSAYCGVVIPVGQILSQVFERRGLTMQSIATFRQTRGNGNHQHISEERLNEVIVTAKFFKSQ